MTNVRVSLPTVLMIAALVGAGAFAAGRLMSPPSSPSAASFSPPSEPLEPTNPAAETNEPLPPGHPPVDSVDPAGAPTAGGPAAAQPPLEWKAPAQWQLVPNASTMRFATYRVPHAAGDSEDAEVSVVQAGGSVDANAERWIGQFDAAGQKTAKRSIRKVGTLEVTIVEVQGKYSGGMGKEPSSATSWALLGAIVATPDSPCFFKLTGPAKTVLAARAEFDAMIGSLVPRGP